jgi:hypothetical protein
MSAFRMCLAFGAAIAILALPVVAQAQTPSGAIRSASIATSGDKSGSAGKWICMSTATVEIAPVSFDARGLADAWVMVHRDKGEIVAAERVSQKQVEQIRRLPCGTRDSDKGGLALVG